MALFRIAIHAITISKACANDDLHQQAVVMYGPDDQSCGYCVDHTVQLLQFDAAVERPLDHTAKLSLSNVDVQAYDKFVHGVGAIKSISSSIANVTKVNRTEPESTVGASTSLSGFGRVNVLVGSFSFAICCILCVIAFLVPKCCSPTPRENGAAASLVATSASDVPDKIEGGKDCEDKYREPPVWLRRLCVIGNMLIMINFTIVIPGSREAALEHGEARSFSGFIVGIYAAGAIISLPAMRYFAENSYRTGLLLMGITGIAGNLIYASAVTFQGKVGAQLLLVARFVCGLEGGNAMLVASAMQADTGSERHVQMLAQLASAASVGLMCGPACASFARTLAGNDTSAEAPVAILMIVMSVVFFLVVALKCPTQEECRAHAGHTGTKLGTEVPQKSIEFLKASWLSLILNVAMQSVRYFQRVFWETFALYILSEEYGLGSVRSGYLLSMTVFILLLMPLICPHLHRKYGFRKYVLIMDILCLVAFVLMFRVGKPSRQSQAMFLFGSALFYFANWSQGLAINAQRVRYKVQNHWCLSIEGASMYIWFFTYLAYFAGPVLAMEIAPDSGSAQNLLPYALILSTGGWILGREAVLYSMPTDA